MKATATLYIATRCQKSGSNYVKYSTHMRHRNIGHGWGTLPHACK